MRLLFFRHGIADDRESFALTGSADDQRPLTDRGRRRTRAAAGGLARLVPKADLIATSPLVRARQTAQIVAEVLAHEPVAETPVLRPSAHPRELITWLSARPETIGTAILVGHEPHISSTVSWLLCGSVRPLLEAKKASAVLLEIFGGSATLIWSLPPRALRGLAPGKVRQVERKGKRP